MADKKPEDVEVQLEETTGLYHRAFFISVRARY